MRIVIEAKRDVSANVLLNKLFQLTPLQSSFSINNVCLVKGRPHTLNIKEMMRYFVDHRHEVVVRRTQYELDDAQKRAHILEGLLIALDHLDEVIALIRGSRTVEIARNGLMEKFELSEVQVKAILDMRLQKLTGLEREKIQEQYNELMERITYYKRVLSEESLRMEIIKDELGVVKDKFGDERRTQINHAAGEIRMEDLLENKEMIVTITYEGYMKRTEGSEYRVQGRGGTGFKGAGTKDKDFIEHIFSAMTHNYLLMFTEKGRCFWLRIWDIPKGLRTFKGRAIQNLIKIDPDDKVKAYITVEDLQDDEFLDSHYIVMATRKGQIKKTSLRAYSRVRSNGINAIVIREDDELLEVKLTDGNSQIILGSRNGMAIRFNEKDVREMGRMASGVRGIRLKDEADDEVVGMVVAPADEDINILVVSQKGYGKQTPLSEYRVINRGGKGVKTLKVSDKTGQMLAIKQGVEDDDLMIITKNGTTIRLKVDSISQLGRNTQGVKLIRLKKRDEIASVARVAESDEEEEEIEGEGEALTNDQHIETPTSDVDVTKEE